MYVGVRVLVGVCVLVLVYVGDCRRCLGLFLLCGVWFLFSLVIEFLCGFG